MVERCGDRQRKFVGLEKWPFRLFINSLPIMLQIALLLLACGLSRYVWSVNTSVARVVISFTVLGILFYLGIVIAGASSYQCPFQTPASTALRDLKESGTIQQMLASMSPFNAISLIHATWNNTRQVVAFVSHRVYDLSRYPFSRRNLYSRVSLRVNRAFRIAKYRLAQGINSFRRAELPPVTLRDIEIQPPALGNDQGLRVCVRNLEGVMKQNEDNASCVCWVLRNITDPEAIDSAIRLAGSIRWFVGDSDHKPPFDVIVSTFEACFDSTKQLYPGTRDRAYFSARAILQISTSARAQSHKDASRYPIPAVSLNSFQQMDPDLQHIILILQRNFDAERPVFPFPKEGTYDHLLWVSNLLMDMAHMGPNPSLESHRSHLNIAVTDQPAIIANVLLMWYMLLGGHVEEETFWAVDKSYVTTLLFFLSPCS
jgi:hypothetical protein